MAAKVDCNWENRLFGQFVQVNFEIYILLEEQLNVQRNDILIDDMYYQNK